MEAKTIKIYTNIVLGGWSAKDLETGIGGSEEKLIELAKELAKTNKVTIYHNGMHGTFDGVEYLDHPSFKPYEPFDIFISFKNREIIRQSINAKKVIYFTTEIQGWQDWELEQVDNVVTISQYHNHRMVKNDKIKPLYLWADLERLDRNKVDKEPNTMLYCSSFDRGLEELLSNWGTIREKLKLDKLYITYGWEFFDNMIKGNPALVPWKNRMVELMKQEGIELVGRQSNDDMCKYYWRSQYWCLPLNNPDSELFCINAIKAQYCGAIPVVRRIGALQETVNEFIDFDSLRGQKVGQDHLSDKAIEANKKHASKFSMDIGVNKWIELLES